MGVVTFSGKFGAENSHGVLKGTQMISIDVSVFVFI